jgi:hypothetical protein
MTGAGRRLGALATKVARRARRGSRYQTLSCAGEGLGAVRTPPATDPSRWGRVAMKGLPRYDPSSSAGFQVDLRSRDVSALDLRDRLDDLLKADYDSRTRWPALLPPQFDPAPILETAKNPGLRVRELHHRGITGEGIGIAVIDQPLLVDHVEYRDQLRLYEEIHVPKGCPAQMHGPAVAALAVGRTTGVAPGADLYYIAEQHGTYPMNKFRWDFTWLARSIDRILDINQGLPTSRRIRVISVSVGWSPHQKWSPCSWLITTAPAR